MRKIKHKSVRDVIFSTMIDLHQSKIQNKDVQITSDYFCKFNPYRIYGSNNIVFRATSAALYINLQFNVDSILTTRYDNNLGQIISG